MADKLYDDDGREYTPSVSSTTGLNEPVAAESTDPASEPAQVKE